MWSADFVLLPVLDSAHGCLHGGPGDLPRRRRVQLVVKSPFPALGKRGLLVEVLEIWDCECPEMLMERVPFGNVRETAAAGDPGWGLRLSCC